jgi:hypothetical protein
MFECLSDCLHSNVGWTGVNSNWYPGNYNATMAANWGGSRLPYAFYDARKTIWDGVRQSWIFIENIDRVPDMTDSEKKRLKAEAKIIIATRYFDLLRHVGGLPLVDHAYVAGEEFVPRATIEETINFVVGLLDEAAGTSELPWNIPSAENENWAGRLTKASALGVKCKVLLYAASPLFNSAEPYTNEEPQTAVDLRQVWYGSYKPELWAQCLQACEDFFRINSENGNYYHLVQPTDLTEAGYAAAYRSAYWTRGNSEKVLEVHNVFKQAEWDQMPGNLAHYGGYAPTLEFMELFPYADGKNFNPEGIYNNENPNDIDIFKNRDPRLYETMVVQKEGLRWQGNQIELWVGGSMLNGTAFWPANQFMPWGLPQYKWILDYQHIADESSQWPYLRMAELHLIYAEALAETGNLSKACEEVNKVRRRVGLGNIETSNPELSLTTNKENLINEIIRERGCELGYEDTRFLDLVRRKLVSKFTAPLHKLEIYRKDGINKPLEEGEAYPKFRYEKKPITDYARAWWQPGFWTNKWFLDAFPIDEINKDYGLTQNPGW